MKKKALASSFLVVALGISLPSLKQELGGVPARERRESAAFAAESSSRGSTAKLPARPNRVVLVVIDGVRWQDVFEGVDRTLAQIYRLSQDEVVGPGRLVPNLHRLATSDGIAVGAPGYGEPMRAAGPHYVSQPGYLELFTERPAATCFSNECPPVKEPTFLDAVASATPPGEASAAVVASWEVIARTASAAPKDFVLSAGQQRGANQDALGVSPRAIHALEAARTASPSPGHGEYRPDRYTREIALAYLEERHPRFLFLGLGDSDEYAHQGDYRGYLRALHEADKAVGELLETLDRMGDDGRNTTVLVTTDHGRERAFMSHGSFAPESARVWMVAAGNVQPLGRIPIPRTTHLYDVGPTIRALMGLPEGAGPGSPIRELAADTGQNVLALDDRGTESKPDQDFSTGPSASRQARKPPAIESTLR